MDKLNKLELKSAIIGEVIDLQDTVYYCRINFLRHRRVIWIKKGY